MKKTISIVVAFSLLFAILAVAGCNSAQSTVKLGLGSVTSIAKSKDATAEVPASAQVDTTVVAVILDSKGKIVSVTIDTAQTTVKYDLDMQVTSDKSAPIKSKKELGFDYGLSKRSEIGKEWHEQIAAFEDWMIGKTVDEVKNLKVKEVDASHPSVPDIPELTSSVTITVNDYIAALVKAAANTVEVKSYDSMGLGIIGSIASSGDATEAAPAKGQVDSAIAATAFDKKGNIVGAILDTAQASIPYDADGKVTVDKNAAIKTKKELKEDYGMNWYEQVDAFEEWMTGKPIDDVVNLKLADRGNPDVPELTSSVTITITDLIAAVQESYRYKR